MAALASLAPNKEWAGYGVRRSEQVWGRDAGAAGQNFSGRARRAGLDQDRAASGPAWLRGRIGLAWRGVGGCETILPRVFTNGGFLRFLVRSMRAVSKVQSPSVTQWRGFLPFSALRLKLGRLAAGRSVQLGAQILGAGQIDRADRAARRGVPPLGDRALLHSLLLTQYLEVQSFSGRDAAPLIDLNEADAGEGAANVCAVSGVRGEGYAVTARKSPQSGGIAQFLAEIGCGGNRSGHVLILRSGGCEGGRLSAGNSGVK